MVEFSDVSEYWKLVVSVVFSVLALGMTVLAYQVYPQEHRKGMALLVSSLSAAVCCILAILGCEVFELEFQYIYNFQLGFVLSLFVLASVIQICGYFAALELGVYDSNPFISPVNIPMSSRASKSLPLVLLVLTTLSAAFMMVTFIPNPEDLFHPYRFVFLGVFCISSLLQSIGFARFCVLLSSAIRSDASSGDFLSKLPALMHQRISVSYNVRTRGCVLALLAITQTVLYGVALLSDIDPIDDTILGMVFGLQSLSLLTTALLFDSSVTAATPNPVISVKTRSSSAARVRTRSRMPTALQGLENVIEE